MVDANFDLSRQTASPERLEPKTFSLDVDIEGLPFVFKGKTPEKPDSFILSVHIPEREKELLFIEPKVKRTDPFFYDGLFLFKQDGLVGYIEIGRSSIVGGININQTKSYLGEFPTESRYHGGRGVGRFLTDNLLTLADFRGWSIVSIPEPEGRLSRNNLIEWAKRKGYVYDEKKEKFIRQPQKPDMRQAIARVLK